MKGTATITFNSMEQITLELEDTRGCIISIGNLTMFVVSETRSLSYNTLDIARVEINDCEKNREGDE